MIIFLLRRIGAGIVLVFVVTTLTFFMTYSQTDQVARQILGHAASAGALAAENHRLGLDRPILTQYWSWLTSALHGDLGHSYYTGQPIVDALATRLPITLSIALLAIVITAVASVAVGVGAALRGGVLDKIMQGLTLVGYVLPSFLLGIILVVVFALTLRLVPATGFVPFTESPTGWFASVILPAVTLAVGAVASVATQVRASMLEELSKDYVRTLRSRSIPEFQIMTLHVLRNAAGPALTVLSLNFIGLFGGALIIEKIFALSGFGDYSYTSTIQTDLPAVVGVVAATVVIVVVVNLVIDLLGGLLNPKARTR